MGDREVGVSASMESMLGYHSLIIEVLTLCHDLGKGQCQVDSLTGAVASQRATEAFKGSLRMVGNHSQSVKA